MFVTVNVYEVGVRPDIVVDTPVPEYVFPPGERVIVQPPAGSPLKVTLPVASVHVGCTTPLTVGAEGFCWNVMMTSSVDEVHGGLLIVQRRV
jgi:hypothetical protein